MMLSGDKMTMMLNMYALAKQLMKIAINDTTALDCQLELCKKLLPMRSSTSFYTLILLPTPNH